MQHFIRAILTIGILGFILSCDPGDFELPAYQSDLFLPLLDVELSAENIFLADSNELFKEDSTGLISLQYSLMESSTFEDLLPITDQESDFVIPGIPGGLADNVVTVPVILEVVGIGPGEYPFFPATSYDYSTEVNANDFIRAEFSSGTISIKLTNNSPLTLQQGFLLEIVNISENEPFIQLTMNQEVAPGESFTFQDQLLTGKSLTGDFIFKILNLGIREQNDVTILTDDAIDIEFAFDGINLKQATFKAPEIDLPAVTFDMPVLLPFGILLKRMFMDDGLLVIEIPQLVNDFTLNVGLLSASKDSQPVNFIIGLDNTELSMKNLEIDFTGPGGDLYNILPVQLDLEFNSELDTFNIVFDQELSGNISITNIDYDYIEGYLGKTDIVGEGSINPNLFNRVQSGVITFDDPRITTTISNGAGTTAIIRDDGQGLYIRGQNNRLSPGNIVEIGNSIEGFVLQPAVSLSQPQLSTFEINKTTEPKFSEFLATFPNQIEARIPIQLGSDEIILNQFIKDDAIVALDMTLDLPMKISADRFVMLDTVEFTFDIDAEKFEAKSASMTANYESYFPLEFIFQTVFLNENFEVIDSLFNQVELIQSAEIDVNGNVVEPLKGSLFSEISADQLDLLRTTAYAVPVIRFQTPNSTVVELKSFYTFRMKMAGEIVTDIDFNP